MHVTFESTNVTTYIELIRFYGFFIANIGILVNWERIRQIITGLWVGKEI